MGKALETFRREQLRPGDPLDWHPVNQKMAKDIQDRRRRGNSPKVERAARKKLQQEQFLQEFPKMQFNRALGQMLNGTVTEENVKYVSNNVQKYEKLIDTYETEKSTVTITVVDFTRSNSKNLP